MKRISWLLVLTLLLASCSSSGVSEQTETALSSDTTEEIVTTEKITVPVKDFGGQEFHFMIRWDTDGWDWNVSDFVSDGLNGEPINDAVYNRNIKIMSDYNCNITYEKTNAATGSSALKSAILSGDDSYDAVLFDARSTCAFGLEGLLHDLNTVSSIDTTKDYWNPYVSDVITVGGCLFGAMGDLSTIDNRAVRCLYFNKDVFDKYNLAYPYQSVKDGTWTHDAFFGLVKQGTIDLNGDGNYDDNDQWGLFAQSSIGKNLYYSSGHPFVAKSTDGLLTSYFNTPESVNIMAKVAERVLGTTDCMLLSNDYQKYQPLFAEGHSLFYSEVSIFIKTFRQYDFEVGMLPMPKYDENQEHYCQYADGYCLNLVSIPITNQTPEDVGLLLEALSVESVDTLTPAYYDICLNGKEIRDEESSEMLDIIFSSYIVDAGDLYQMSFINSFANMLNGKSEVASTVAGVVSQADSEIQKVNDTVLSLKK